LVYSTPKHCLPSALLRLQVLFTAELNRRLAAAGSSVQALSLHPGNVLTNVVQSLPAAIQSLYRAIMVRVLLTPEQGAAQEALSWRRPAACG
jgi:NAD(P)-dependent dehydrogenase (short-subunit alcohol dehydrogenase family)